ncbi:murein biosynthesis integral membrane protein MurJ [Caloramator sp. ALD01]|uniref:murein biosynthesis integral membrane protein MurJ n=1 Tax=Caloramator sp. ALD01 TaxID=1031288 RepID=UPI0004266E8D|nr:murein biosynthesis integral membrane protein MurJ [Caloramator sp. ALD01]
MKKTAFLLMILTVLAKVLGFLREVCLSYFIGANNVSDAYLVAITIPTVIFSFIGIALNTGFIPMYSDIKRNKGTDEANLFTNNLINFLLLISTIIVIISFTFTEPIVKIFASGFVGETLKLAITFTRISIFAVYFTGTVFVLAAYLQVNNNFAIPALLGIPSSIAVIISIVLAAKINNIFLGIGIIISYLVQLLFLLPYVKKCGYKFSKNLNLKDEHLKSMFLVTLPAILGASVGQISVLVDRTIASAVVEGGISALNYANKLNLFVINIVVTSISTVIYPILSLKVSENDINGLKSSISESINLMTLLIIPATVGAMVFSKPIVKMLFGRGAFDEKALIMTSQSLLFYSIGMIAYGQRDILTRVFYSMKDTKTPTVNAVIAIILNIILDFILSKYMGISGIAFATSISMLFCTFLLFISIRKKIGKIGLRDMLLTFVKILIASLVMGIVSKICFEFLKGYLTNNKALIISIFIAIIIYGLVIIFLRIPEVDEIIIKIKKKFIKK